MQAKIYLLIDALDECEPLTRKALLDCLAKLFTSRERGTMKAKFLITCRPDQDIRNCLLDIGGYVQIDSANVNADLSKFIQVKVEDLSRKKGYSPDLSKKVQDRLMAKAGGTFLWVSLVLVDLEKSGKFQVEKKLQSIPKTLNDVYDRILKQIEMDCVEDAAFVLCCVAIAQRPPDCE